VDHYIRANLNLSPDEKFYRGQGCEACNQMGYRGRATVCELLAVTPEIAQLINDGAPTQKLQEVAVAQGMTRLGDNAIALARAHKTSIEEIITVQLEHG